MWVDYLIILIILTIIVLYVIILSKKSDTCATHSVNTQTIAWSQHQIDTVANMLYDELKDTPVTKSYFGKLPKSAYQQASINMSKSFKYTDIINNNALTSKIWNRSNWQGCLGTKNNWLPEFIQNVEAFFTDKCNACKLSVLEKKIDPLDFVFGTFSGDIYNDTCIGKQKACPPPRGKMKHVKVCPMSVHDGNKKQCYYGSPTCSSSMCPTDSMLICNLIDNKCVCGCFDTTVGEGFLDVNNCDCKSLDHTPIYVDYPV